jgi:Ni,Fe-hydrogenase III large subunit/Ni,Fe-hydrogenase III component G
VIEISVLTDVLKRELPRIEGLRVVRGNELHVSLGRTETMPLAQLLRERFSSELSLMVAQDLRRDGKGFAVHHLFAPERGNAFVHATVSLPAESPSLISLASFYYPASRFEREIDDLFGIPAEGHPDPRPLVRHGFWPTDFFPLRKDAQTPDFRDDGRPFPFQQVGGEGVYEIPVGPVHAGVIEPGHFRFSVLGETIIDMKARLYFTHKGTEKLFEGRAPESGLELAERISGDTSFGHGLAYCQAIEAASGVRPPARARYLRVLLLELERLYNHIGDFGAIVNDTGFAVAHSHCFRIRERLLRLNKRLTGNRLLRGGLVPGGVTFDLPAGAEVASEVEDSVRDFQEIAELSLENTLVLDRLEGAGRLSTQTARDHGALGFIARASGIDVDVRRDHPFAAYDELSFEVPVFESGDVKARTLMRVEEARQSARLIRQVMDKLPDGPLAEAMPRLPAFETAFSMVEGWRGKILHWVAADSEGKLDRVKVFDPSFLNWRPLSYALLKNIVPDFPLCNKSFNQSYSGHDL